MFYLLDEIKRQLLDANAKAVFTLTTLYSLAAAAVKLGNSSIPIITIKTQVSDIFESVNYDILKQFAFEIFFAYFLTILQLIICITSFNTLFLQFISSVTTQLGICFFFIKQIY